MSHRITRTKSAGASCRHGSRCNYDWADIIREYSGSSRSILAKQIKQIKATRSRKASWYLSKPQAIVSLGFSHSNAPSLTKNPVATGTISCHLNPSARPFDFFNHSVFFVGDLRSYASSRVQPIDVAETWQFRGKRNVLAVLDNAERGSKCIQCIQCKPTMLGRVPRKFCAHTEVCDAPSTRKSGTVSWWVHFMCEMTSFVLKTEAIW